MEEIRRLLDDVINENLVQVVLSNTRDAGRGTKVKVRPVLLKEELLFQETLYLGTQVFHKNFDGHEMRSRLQNYLEELFRQGEFKTLSGEATVRVSKKGSPMVKRKGIVSKDSEVQRTAEAAKDSAVANVSRLQQLSHNRTKQYILQEGEPVDFLVGLGVQTPEGKITKARYDKFRQINRYLEFIEDVLEDLPKDRTIRIIDFGCGKSYLTFAMYYYLHELQKRDIRVTGLDLKSDVIDHCNELARKLGYQYLEFEKGDISTYEGADAVDMVVSLHACDTATDYALEKAVKWNASVIMAVPCCQHELNKQMKSEELKPVLKYGLIKERMAALITDALRANLLEQEGYETQIVEFIDMEHTPKNLLIRAVKRKGMQPQGKISGERATNKNDISKVKELLNLSPTLEKLLKG